MVLDAVKRHRVWIGVGLGALLLAAGAFMLADDSSRISELEEELEEERVASTEAQEEIDDLRDELEENSGGGSTLVPVEPEPLSAPTVAVERCLDAGGAAELSSEDISSGGARGVMLVGFGPGGGKIGVVFAEDAFVAEIAGKSIAAEDDYSVSRSADGKTLAVFGRLATEDDEALVAECISE